MRLATARRLPTPCDCRGCWHSWSRAKACAMFNAATLDRDAIKATIDALIGLLDAIDGDADLEEADGCEDADPGEDDCRRLAVATA